MLNEYEEIRVVREYISSYLTVNIIIFDLNPCMTQLCRDFQLTLNPSPTNDL